MNGQFIDGLVAWLVKLIDNGVADRAIDAFEKFGDKLFEVLKEAIWLITH